MKEQLSDKELAEIDITVPYECICQKGYFGSLCDESEADRQCQEVYCLGRGKGNLDLNGKCHCECEKQFFGNRCEQLSACYDTQCDNGGICEDVVDLQKKTVTATCNCPSSLEIIGGTVTGESCENLQIPKTIPKELVPCAEGGNSASFFKKLIAQIDIGFDKDIVELEAIAKDYEDGKTPNGRMVDGWCENGGKCVPEVIRVETSRAYYIHRCECTNPLTDGYYCEYKRHDACSLTREEVIRGARWDEKCTDSQHGSCVDLHGDATCVDIPSDDDLMPLCNDNEKLQGFRCLCEAGYLPPYCKIHTNPCYHNLCQNSATCIEDPKQRTYECQCVNGTRGALCETIDDSCDAFGSKVCEHGTCINDQYFHRGFSCECDEDYEGLDCDVAIGLSRRTYHRITKHYQYTFPLLACLLSLTVILVLVLFSRKQRVKSTLDTTLKDSEAGLSTTVTSTATGTATTTTTTQNS
uniref:Delta-like protein n=1 Tax=Caenorhabditis tropicalis TaxID=1561998 RepID=A0A1I7UVA3_9PELO